MYKTAIKNRLIKILTGSDLSKRVIPYMSIRSENEGPLIWLVGCIHGDEIGGTVIIHEIFKRIGRYLKKGSIHAFPLVNPLGFENATRAISISGEDLNRAFPGNPKGTFAQRVAYHVFTHITNTHPDLVLDLHNDWNKSVPYALIDPISENSSLEKTVLEYAAQTGLIQIRDIDLIKNSLSYNLLREEIPSLTLECGESMIINEKNVEYGINAVWNILMKNGMVENTVEHFQFPLPASLKDKVLFYSSKPLCPASGIIRFSKKPGQMVRPGDSIARIYNSFGKRTETITAIHEGIILGHSDYAIAYPGAPIMAFGITNQLN